VEGRRKGKKKDPGKEKEEADVSSIRASLGFTPRIA